MVGDPVSGDPARPIHADIAPRVLAWYAVHGRRLAIRESSEPYVIWLAETMSQQTQIDRVGVALPGFVDRFPSLDALAAAPTDTLLRAWADLGYPRRALALREAARTMAQRHGGQVPRSVPELEALPGIGPYTARAVAATAFGVPVTALDVNARRVLARVTGITLAHATTRAFGAWADALAPPDRAADWNHALMDLGATVCRARPDCRVCPLRDLCRSADHVPDGLPATPSRRRPAFRDTNRYVRGRILASLRAAPPGTLIAADTLVPSIGRERVGPALAGLVRDGLVTIGDAGLVRLPDG